MSLLKSFPAALLISGALAACPVEGAGIGRMNLVFIIADDLRDVWNLDSGNVATPHLDTLRNRSVVFNRAYCANPMCNPSRVSMLSGMRSCSTGVYNNKPLAPEVLPGWRWLPQHIRESGYTTYNHGKIFHPAGSPDAIPPGCFHSIYNPWESKYDGDRVVAERAVAEITKHESTGSPYAIFVGFSRPHAPFGSEVLPPAFVGRHDPATLILPEPDDIPVNQGYAYGAFQEWKKFPLSDAQQRATAARYYDSVAYMDEQAGKVLAAIDWSDTVVIFTSDHGYQLGEHGGYAVGKAFNKNTCSRVPLFVYCPGCDARQSNALVELLDLYPTLIDFLGLPPTPEPIEGQSFAALMTARIPHKSVAFSEYGRNRFEGWAAHTANWSWSMMRNGQLLEDPYTDPHGFENLYQDPLHAGTIANIQSQVPPKMATYNRVRQPIDPVSSTPGDPDRDGINNSWEIRLGLSMVFPNTTTDQDGDGHSDRREFAFGSNPHDPTHVPLSLIFTDQEQVSIFWRVRPGFDYEVETSSNSHTWHHHSSVVPEGSLLLLEQPVLPDGNRYFRLRHE